MADAGVRFIRKNGRVIPIRDSSGGGGSVNKGKAASMTHAAAPRTAASYASEFGKTAAISGVAMGGMAMAAGASMLGMKRTSIGLIGASVGVLGANAIRAAKQVRTRETLTGKVAAVYGHVASHNVGMLGTMAALNVLGNRSGAAARGAQGHQAAGMAAVLAVKQGIQNTVGAVGSGAQKLANGLRPHADKMIDAIRFARAKVVKTAANSAGRLLLR